MSEKKRTRPADHNHEINSAVARPGDVFGASIKSDAIAHRVQRAEAALDAHGFTGSVQLGEAESIVATDHARRDECRAARARASSPFT